MYYFVITSPESSGVNLSLYFTDYRSAIEYAKSVEKNNPMIVKYDTSKDYTMMYDNILSMQV